MFPEDPGKALATHERAVFCMAEWVRSQWWRGCVIFAVCLLVVGLLGVWVVLSRGVGVWGIHSLSMWGWPVVNFVWWVGIAHAGTLLSAVLLLLRQGWRVTLHRLAETITLLALLCAVIYPALHLGRPWLLWWLVPLPQPSNLWPQFRSPLVWDAIALATYFVVSALFWLHSLVPDSLVLSRHMHLFWIIRLVRPLSCHWCGSAEQWYWYRRTSILLAALATTLVVSVHSIVAMDFAATVVTGWHQTIMPPYFVAGAVFSGCAMVLTLAAPLQRLTPLKDLIAIDHLQALSKVMLASGLVVLLFNLIEVSQLWIGSPDEIATMRLRLSAPDNKLFLWMLLLNGLVPQLLWFGRVRRHPWLLFFVALAVDVGMWLERRWLVGYLNFDCGLGYQLSLRPTVWDLTMVIFGLGFFLMGFLAMLRWVPMVDITELIGQQEIKEGLWPLGEFMSGSGTSGGRLLLRFGNIYEAVGFLKLLQTREQARPSFRIYSALPTWHVVERAARRDCLGVKAAFAGVGGATVAYWLFWYTNEVVYPIRVAGRGSTVVPIVPVLLEVSILFAALAVFVSGWRAIRRCAGGSAHIVAIQRELRSALSTVIVELVGCDLASWAQIADGRFGASRLVIDERTLE